MHIYTFCFLSRKPENRLSSPFMHNRFPPCEQVPRRMFTTYRSGCAQPLKRVFTRASALVHTAVCIEKKGGIPCLHEYTENTLLWRVQNLRNEEIYRCRICYFGLLLLLIIGRSKSSRFKVQGSKAIRHRFLEHGDTEAQRISLQLK